MTRFLISCSYCMTQYNMNHTEVLDWRCLNIEVLNHLFWTKDQKRTSRVWQCCWRHWSVGDIWMLVIRVPHYPNIRCSDCSSCIECLVQTANSLTANTAVRYIFWISMPDAFVKWMRILLVKIANSISKISKLLPTNSIYSVRQQ